MRSSERNRARRLGRAAGLSGKPGVLPYRRTGSRPLARVWTAAYEQARREALAGVFAAVSMSVEPMLGVFKLAARAFEELGAGLLLACGFPAVIL